MSMFHLLCSSVWVYVSRYSIFRLLGHSARILHLAAVKSWLLRIRLKWCWSSKCRWHIYFRLLRNLIVPIESISFFTNVQFSFCFSTWLNNIFFVRLLEIPTNTLYVNLSMRTTCFGLTAHWCWNMWYVDIFLLMLCFLISVGEVIER